MIAIIDYGVGNLGSVFNMFKRIGAKAIITSDVKEIQKADKILLPGVGAFDTAMAKLNESNLIPVIKEAVFSNKKPILGICLGMQLLTQRSDEGALAGLGWIEAETLSFQKVIKERIPHMGWNTITIKNENPMTKGFDEESKFYFVHSYYVSTKNIENKMFGAKYDINFDAGIFQDNIFGVQFHPEKSHKFGMKLFDNFNKL